MKFKKCFIIKKHTAGKNCNGNMELFELSFALNTLNFSFHCSTDAI